MGYTGLRRSKNVEIVTEEEFVNVRKDFNSYITPHYYVFDFKLTSDAKIQLLV